MSDETLNEILKALGRIESLLIQMANPPMIVPPDLSATEMRPGGIRWLPTDDGAPVTRMPTGHTSEPTCATTESGKP